MLNKNIHKSEIMLKAAQSSDAVGNFIRVANIIANLDIILTEAKNLSLTAKNARVVALRAGDSAFGFKPITNFIDEFSDQTIKTTAEISKLSNQLFTLALAVVRCSNFINHIQKAKKASDNKTLDKLLSAGCDDLIIKSKDLEHAIFNLESYFEDIQKQMRSAEYIAVTSRVEASNAGDFSESLQGVSDFIASAAKRIKAAVTDNLSEISKLRGVMR